MSQYGASFAAKLVAQGRFEDAIAAATRESAIEPDSPEPLVTRAAGYAAVGRYMEAAADLERAIALDRTARVLDDDQVDDDYFTALLGVAKAAGERSAEEAVATLERYRSLYPRGRHLRDLEDWTKRFRGQYQVTFVKRRVEDPIV